MSNDDSLLKALQEIHKLSATGEALSLPIEIFSDRKLGMLEAAVMYLHDEKGMRFSKIAELLKRDQRTIWTSYNKAKKKKHG